MRFIRYTHTYTPRTQLSHVCVYAYATNVTNSERFPVLYVRLWFVPLPAFLSEQLDHHIGKNDAVCEFDVGGKTVWLRRALVLTAGDYWVMGF